MALDRMGAPDVLRHGRQVRLQHAEGRVHEPVRQVAVVGEQQQPLTVGVEPADVEEPFRTVGHKVADRAPPPRIAHRAQHAAGLVEREVDQVVPDHDPVAVDVDDRGGRIDPPAQLDNSEPIAELI